MPQHDVHTFPRHRNPVNGACGASGQIAPCLAEKEMAPGLEFEKLECWQHLVDQIAQELSKTWHIALDPQQMRSVIK